MNMPSPKRFRTRFALLAVTAALVASVAAGLAFARSGSAPIGTGVVVVDTDLGYQGGQAAGTGMVLSSSGEVLTNNHVIRGATTIKIVVPGTGPGKVTLLERIAREGSISAAGRSMNMSYKRAWELVSEINRTFEAPLVTAQTGGRSGGGAALTERGKELIRHYRAIERKALSATARHIKALQAISRSPLRA